MRNRRLELIIDRKKTDFSKVEDEYSFNMLNDDNTNILYLINNLRINEKRLLILYAELGSMQKVADLYGCSKVTIYKQIEKIRSKIKHKIKTHDY
ncbi:hypothetical protein [Enterocloster citroniae]